MKKNILFGLTMLLFPIVTLAQASNAINDGAQWILDLLTGGLARTAALIAVTILGYLALSGRMDMGRVLWVVIGIVIIFGGSTIVDQLAS